MWPWLRRLLRDDQQSDPALRIVPPVYHYRGHDEGLERRTRERRKAAEVMHARGHAVESGAKVGAVLKMARKG